MNASDSVSLPEHKAKHWEGKYWGEEGAVCAGLFALLSTLISAMKSAPSKTHKFFVGAGIVAIYVALRSSYDVLLLSPNQLDVLASASRGLKQRKHAIRVAEIAINLNADKVCFTSKMLLLAGLMRDHDAIYAADQPGSRAHWYFTELRSSFRLGVYDAPEQEIRILRALAWFTNKYPARNHSDAMRYARAALALAMKLGATDQANEVRREFGHLISA